jgi:transmembrane sensor
MDARNLIQAARWRAHLAEAGAETSVGFEQWLAADPRNAAAWARAQAAWEECDNQAGSPEILALRREALEDAQAQSHQRARQAGARQRWTQRAIAAGLTVVAAGAASVWLMSRPDTYQTNIGERHVVTLEDGSTIMLDSASSVRVSYSDRARELTLVSGQAHFTVAADVERPFSVRAQGRKVLAMGTAFNVDTLGSRLWVTLMEGRVIVLGSGKGSGIELKPGQQLTAGGDSAPQVVEVNPEMATAWEHGELMFDNEPLSQVAARISRYSERKVEVLDARAAALEVSGVFTTGDVDRFVSAVTEYLPLVAETGPRGGVRLRYRDRS